MFIIPKHFHTLYHRPPNTSIVKKQPCLGPVTKTAGKDSDLSRRPSYSILHLLQCAFQAVLFVLTFRGMGILGAARTGMFSSGEYAVGRISKRPSIPFGYPVKNAANEVIAVIGVILNVNFIQEMFEKA